MADVEAAVEAIEAVLDEPVERGEIGQGAADPGKAGRGQGVGAEASGRPADASGRPRVAGAVLEHERLRVSVAGCPNGCSQPQIADVGLGGRRYPGLKSSSCIGCGLCVDTCLEDAFDLSEGTLAFDDSRCVGCGMCIQVCPVGALKAASEGWEVVVGGRLGRHPRLGATVARCVPLDEAVRMLKAVIALQSRKGRPHERVGATLDRLARADDAEVEGSEWARGAAIARLLEREAAP